ncbi:MAG: efflux transporter outer membrane subunit [Phycisphaeraceae bacterium]|nr:efflux transporter outer membrane subunit [Phycisphaeraceae bacterium]
MNKTDLNPRVLIAIAALCAIGACHPVGPDYKRPETASPEVFRGQAQPQEKSLAETNWWDIYEDPVLQELIREGLTNNFDTRIAVARVEQARELAAQARSLYYPTVNYQAALAGGRNDFVGTPVLNNGVQGGTGFGIIGAAWELDVWGRIRRLNEQALAEYLATEEAKNAVIITVLAEIATAYFQLLELDLEREIAIRTEQSFAESLKLFTQRLKGGAGSRLETSRAEASLASVAARVPDLERLITLKENEISVLLGRTPGPIKRGARLTEQTTPPEVPAGIPSQLLERRPDLREAEQRLRAANAAVGVAQADFFPRIGLTTYFGKVSSSLGDLLDPVSTAWSAGGNLLGPLFTGGQLEAQLAQRKAEWDAARLGYQKTAIVALREVSDGLTDREKLAYVRTEQERSVRAFSESVEVAMKRYSAGKASYFEVLEAQQQLFPAENTLAQVRFSQLAAIVRLYKALGGGWNPNTEAEPLPPVEIFSSRQSGTNAN